MLLVLSPAKTLDYTSPLATELRTKPDFMKRSAELIAILRTLSPADLATLMKLSDSLAELNVRRYHDWSPRASQKNARQAVLAFDGDVYDGLQASAMTAPQLDYLQSHLRILSGLYGVLRPLDLMQAYRLEMGTRLQNPSGRDLYAFWGDTVSVALARALDGMTHRILVNLASEEYFKVVKPALLEASVVTPVFEDWKNGQYKIISFFAKRARGMMARYAAVHKIEKPAALQKFDLDGYRFDAAASDTTTWRFRRRVEA
ncbi:MAG: peroxide stress protein YaaA [Herminiimonas sp.]|nr:peroxide stress protein YaaA [Herminiimonas sp.]